MNQSFLQTREWLDFQESLGRKSYRFGNEAIQANVIRHDIPLGKSYLYIPHGPSFLNLPRPEEVLHFVAELKKIGQENKSIFVRMEPLDDAVPKVLFENKVKLKLSKKHLQPQRTTILDLKFSDGELLSGMHHKTRYNINLSEKKGLELVDSHDVESFIKILKKTAKEDGFSTHEPSYYRKMLEFFDTGKRLKARLYLVHYKKRVIAGAITMEHADTVYYLHGALDREYRDLMAPYFLHWGIIQVAKRLGFSRYDFWGIDANRWPGVTRFKLGFGGQVIERPGTFELTLSWFWHRLYRTIKG